MNDADDALKNSKYCSGILLLIGLVWFWLLIVVINSLSRFYIALNIPNKYFLQELLLIINYLIIGIIHPLLAGIIFYGFLNKKKIAVALSILYFIFFIIVIINVIITGIIYGVGGRLSGLVIYPIAIGLILNIYLVKFALKSKPALN